MTSSRCMFFSLVLVLSGFFSVSAQAVLAPSAPMIYSQPIAPSTAQALCDYYTTTEGRAAGYYQLATGSGITAGTNTSTVGGVVYYKAWGAAGSTQYCLNAATGGARANQITPTQYCTNASISGQYPNATCAACPAGYTDQNGVCAVPVVCPAAGTPITWPDGAEVITAVGGSVSSLCGTSGCSLTVTGSEVILPMGGGQEKHFILSAKYTGVAGTACQNVTAPAAPITDLVPAADTPTGVPASQADCPTGSAFGQVNGVNVCAPSGTKISYQPEDSTSTANGDTLNTTTTKTDTVQADGTVKSTTTSTATGSGGTSTTSSSTSTGDGSGFGTAGSGGGGCKGLECGVNLGPAPPAESGSVDSLIDAPGSGADGSGGAVKVFTPAAHFAGQNTCIADRTINVPSLSISVTIPLSALCPWFDMMYKIISMVSIFVAMRIIVMS